MGWIGQSVPSVKNMHNSTKKVKLIWQSIIHIWKLHNQHLYPANHLQEDQTQLQATIQQNVHNAQHDPIFITTFPISIPTSLAKPICKLRQWSTNSHNHMHAKLKIKKIQANLHTHNNKCYFLQKPKLLQPPTKPTATAKNLLWPP